MYTRAMIITNDDMRICFKYAKLRTSVVSGNWRRYCFSAKRAVGRAFVDELMFVGYCPQIGRKWRTVGDRAMYLTACSCLRLSILAADAVWHHIRRLTPIPHPADMRDPPLPRCDKLPFTCAHQLIQRVRFRREPVLISVAPENRPDCQRMQ